MEKSKKWLVNNTELFYFVGLSIAFFSFTWLKWNDAILAIINEIEFYRYLLACFFLGLRFLSLFFIDIKHFYKCIFLFLIFGISYFFVKSVYLIQCVVILVLSYKIEFKKIVKLLLTFSLIVFMVDIIGILTSNIEVFIAKGRYRCYMGFTHPSYFSVHFITIVYSIWYLYLRKYKILTTIIFFISGALLWFLPNTMATSIIMFLTPFVLLISKFILIKNIKILKQSILVLPIILLLASVLLVYFSDSINLSILPETLRLRLSIPKNFWIENGIHLLRGSNMWVDNSYMFLLELFGIIPTFIYLLFFIKTSKKIVDNGNYYILTIYLSLLIYSLIDNYCLNPRYNLALFYLYTLDKEIDFNE